MHAAANDEATEIEMLVAELAERIGPRRPTSAEEARAAAFVNGRLRRAGMGVAESRLGYDGRCPDCGTAIDIRGQVMV
ncbi:MAG: hypothetical protein ACPL8I_05650 [Chloroflexaceae bacterium]